MIDRDAVRDTAKYLRNVRPIDPDEIHEYVDGQPHPAVVRQTLREEAFDLGLVEREDGTFVPVSEAPLDRPTWEPDELPERYAFALEDLLVARFGANWHRGASGDDLREAIRRLKADYYHGNPVEYDETAALGYAVYHLPDYYAAVGYVLDDLAENDLLSRTSRVVDVGAGVGGPALGLHDYLRAAGGDDDVLVDYHAVEPSASADVLAELLEETDRNFRTTIHRERAEDVDPGALMGRKNGGSGDDDADIDLLCFCSVLSELDDPVAVVERFLPRLADDGTVLLLAPADLNTATGLREVERALADRDDLTVYAPDLRLWPGESPSDRGWSFEVATEVAVAPFQRRLDAARGDDDPEGTFTKTTVQFSSALLRPDGERRVPVRADPDRHAKMAETERHVGKRIDLLAVKLSGDLSDGGNPLFKVGDGSEATEHYAVLTRESALNDALARAPYGAVLSFENVLALWNDDEGAYNLVVEGETVVDLVAP